jgi:hypothetical protein
MVVVLIESNIYFVMGDKTWFEDEVGEETGILSL